LDWRIISLFKGTKVFNFQIGTNIIDFYTEKSGITNFLKRDCLLLRVIKTLDEDIKNNSLLQTQGLEVDNLLNQLVDNIYEYISPIEILSTLDPQEFNRITNTELNDCLEVYFAIYEQYISDAQLELTVSNIKPSNIQQEIDYPDLLSDRLEVTGPAMQDKQSTNKLLICESQLLISDESFQ
jgi:hypothetical protein